jgi:pimeloyl-ACP methyl ester carboxylesterase
LALLHVEASVSSIVTEQGILHYEYIGRGQPIILLHGWINSWDVWRDCMIALAGTGRYRVYALDFWGFGDSAKGNVSLTSYQINSFVAMVHQFMETLGIMQAPLFGHSMGGTVALQFALRYPDRIKQVAVVGSPITGRSLNFFLKLSGYGWIAGLAWRFPVIRSSIMRMLLARDSKKVHQMISRDLQRTSMDSFFRSIGDLRETDLRPNLPALTIPVLGIYGVHDNIVSPENARHLSNSVQHTQILMMEHSRHFPMTDEPERFLGALSGFLDENNNSSKNHAQDHSTRTEPHTSVQ